MKEKFKKFDYKMEVQKSESFGIWLLLEQYTIEYPIK